MRTGIIFAIFAAAGAACMEVGPGEDAYCEGKCDNLNGECPIPGVTATRVFGALQVEDGGGRRPLREPVGLYQAPGDDSRFYVIEKQGKIWSFENRDDVRDADLFLDLTGGDQGSRVKPDYEEGMLGLAFHPKFRENGIAFVTYNGAGGGPILTDWRLTKFVSRDGGRTLDRSSQVILIQENKPAKTHNAGHIVFGPDGFLYVTLGDGGGVNDPSRNGQNTNTLFGKMLRIDVNKEENGRKYGIPFENPFNPQNPNRLDFGGRAEIFAWGLRNTWSYSFDRETGKIYGGDVGQDAWEEVNEIALAGNYGWSATEANDCRVGPAECAKFTPPVVAIPHINPNSRTGEMRSVTGGFVYRGRDIDKLTGTYIYGDFASGRIYGLPLHIAAERETPYLLAKSGKSISAFAEDQRGEIYVVDYAVGQIFKLKKGTCLPNTPASPSKYQFLKQDGIGNETSAREYYGSTIGDGFETLTLNQWVEENLGDITNPDVANHAYYQNAADLGFWREMYCSKTIDRGQGGCMVRNWDLPTDRPEDPFNPVKNSLGTVTMSVSPQGHTRFYVFGPDGTNSTFAVLDFEDKKFVPELCTVCHGGQYRGPGEPGQGTDLGSIFREFEPSTLIAPEEVIPGTPADVKAAARAELERRFVALNDSARSANLALASEQEGGVSGIDANKQAIIDYIDSIYDPACGNRDTGQACDVKDRAHVPASWATAGNAALARAKENMWTGVVNPYCMGCHRTNNVKFEDYTNFQALEADDEGFPIFRHYAEEDPFDPQRLRYPFMPQAKLTFDNLTKDQDAQAAIDDWLVQANDPAMPQCQVEFVIRNLNWTRPGEDLFIVGEVAKLGTWDWHFSKLLMNGSQFPTWRGTIGLPQGASVQYKGIVVQLKKNGQTQPFPAEQWEDGANFVVNVPVQTGVTCKTTVDRDWRGPGFRPNHF